MSTSDPLDAPLGEVPEVRQVDLVRDVTSVVLVAGTLLLLVSLITFDPADPVSRPIWPLSLLHTADFIAYPTNTQITNACGYWGALIASALFSSIGVSAGLIIAGGGGVAAALITRGGMNAPLLRFIGGTLVVTAVSTAACMLPITIDGMPVVGNGGYWGAMGSTFLLEHFAPMGAWILTSTTLVIGLLMVSDYALLYAGRVAFRQSQKVTRRSFDVAHRSIPAPLRRRKPYTDLEEPLLIEGDTIESTSTDATIDDGPTIKLNRPKRKLEQPVETLPPTTFEDEQIDEAEWEEGSEYEEEEFEPQDDSSYRDLEYEGDEIELRQDEPHSDEDLLEPPSEAHASSEIRVKVPEPKSASQGKKTAKSGENDNLDEQIRESAPEDFGDYRLPALELLQQSDDISYEDQLIEVRRKALLLEQAFRNFDLNIKVVEIETGPVIAQYEIEMEAGLRLSKITGLADDLAIALRVPSVRIVAPIPGKNTVGIEVPNENRQVVRLRDVIEESDTSLQKMNIPVFLGKDVSGNPMVVDLAKMPHLLIAGRTGTGKSVCLNAIITSILMCCRPDEVRMLMIDPKMVELSGYGQLPHLMHPVIVDMKKAEAILAWAVEKMEERYSLLAKVGVRHINSFNSLGRDEILRRLEIDEDDNPRDVPDKLPFIVIVADEMADLMMTAGKDVETHIVRIAQKARAVGIHLILATQKPTVDVITGLIKSNLPARLSFQVASKTDSRVVLDENGAEKLLGNGDMLFLWPGTSTLIRGQGTFLSDEEIDTVCGHCGTAEQRFVEELIELQVNDEDSDGTASMEQIKQRDELYDSAIEVVIREGRGSCSLLQRCLGIGYGRAAKLIDFMAEDGIVGQYNGSKAREVIMTMAQWNAMQGIEEEEGEDPSDAPEEHEETADEGWDEGEYEEVE
ncbi:MAG: DNA translocase FtsK [Planctomycetota bacterium]